jgi:hypothetical protein
MYLAPRTAERLSEKIKIHNEKERDKRHALFISGSAHHEGGSRRRVIDSCEVHHVAVPSLKIVFPTSNAALICSTIPSFQI